MADPTALLVADAAGRAVELVGLPEAGINLAHAVIHLALAPKSNSVITALGAALDTVRKMPAGAVPGHLRDSHYAGAKTLGHGEGYQYPHDADSGWVAQQYVPREVAGTTFYQPGRHGAEAGLVAQWQRRQSVDGSDPEHSEGAGADADQ
jgi:putative ATPase